LCFVGLWVLVELDVFGGVYLGGYGEICFWSGVGWGGWVILFFLFRGIVYFGLFFFLCSFFCLLFCFVFFILFLCSLGVVGEGTKNLSLRFLRLGVQTVDARPSPPPRFVPRSPAALLPVRHAGPPPSEPLGESTTIPLPSPPLFIPRRPVLFLHDNPQVSSRPQGNRRRDFPLKPLTRPPVSGFSVFPAPNCPVYFLCPRKVIWKVIRREEPREKDTSSRAPPPVSSRKPVGTFPANPGTGVLRFGKPLGPRPGSSKGVTSLKSPPPSLMKALLPPLKGATQPPD